MLRRRAGRLVAGVALASAAAAAGAAPPPATCSAGTPFTTALDHLDGYRVYVGPDGDSAVEPLRVDARQVPLLTTGKTIRIIDLPKADRASGIVVGPGDVDLPMHAAPYKEMFVVLGGSFVFKTAKVSIPMGPGSVLLFDDVGAKVGHGGHIGPCGYISLSIKPEK